MNYLSYLLLKKMLKHYLSCENKACKDCVLLNKRLKKDHILILKE